jgi:hypothetical protein
LLNNLPKLTFLNVIVAFYKQDVIDRIKNKLSDLKIKYEINYDYLTPGPALADICIWKS